MRGISGPLFISYHRSMEVVQGVDVICEIPKGSRSKYEIDKATGRLRLDRVLHSSVHYPADYGYIPDTLSADGDCLDAIVIVEEPSFPTSIQKVRPIGVLHMRDGLHLDEKILAVPMGDPRCAQIKRLTDLPWHWKLEISNFFDTYKRLEDAADPVVGEWGDVEEAWEIIKGSQVRATREEAWEIIK